MNALSPRGFFRYVGGKTLIASFILRHLPTSFSLYCEPFAGAASVFWKRPPAPQEVLNDLDPAVMSFYALLKDPRSFARLERFLRYPCYSLSFYRRFTQLFWETIDNPTKPFTEWERALPLYYVRNSTFGGHIRRNSGSWGRCFLPDNKPAVAWLIRYPMCFYAHKRLQNVCLHNEDALNVISHYDSPSSLFYLDPPYHPDTITAREKLYPYEPDAPFYEKLTHLLLTCKGGVALSGYEHPVFETLLKNGWQCAYHEVSCNMAVRHFCSGLKGRGKAREKVPRTEVLYLNPRLLEALHHGQIHPA